MTYAEALARLLALRGGEHAGMRPGLERIEALLEALGHPEQTLHARPGRRHQRQGLGGRHAGRHPQGRRPARRSLHLAPSRRRFASASAWTARRSPRTTVVDGVEALGTLVARLDATVFEATTALALDHFARERVDVAVLEVGLGGRYDATTVGRPGGDRAHAHRPRSPGSARQHRWREIASDKAHIIRSRRRHLRRARQPEAAAPILEHAARAKVPLLVAGRDLAVTLRARGLDGQRWTARARTSGSTGRACGCSAPISRATPCWRWRPRTCSGASERADARGARARPTGRAASRCAGGRAAGSSSTAPTIRPVPARSPSRSRPTSADTPMTLVLGVLRDKDAAGHPGRRLLGRARRVVLTASANPRAASAGRAPAARARRRCRSTVASLGRRRARRAAGPRGSAGVRGRLALPHRRCLALAGRRRYTLFGRNPGHLSTRLRLAMVLMTACLGPAVLPTLSLAQGYRPQPAPSTSRPLPPCPDDAGAPAPGASATPPGAVVVPIAGGDVTVIADQLEEVGPDKLLVATGNVEITHGAARLIADRVELNRDTGDAVAQGRVVFYDGEDRLTGRPGRLQPQDRHRRRLQRPRPGPRPTTASAASGWTGWARASTRSHKGVFTTCEDDSPTWSFRFGSATADLERLRLRHQRLVLGEGHPADSVPAVLRARPSGASGRPASSSRSSAARARRASTPRSRSSGRSTTARIATIAPDHVHQARASAPSAEYRYVLSEQQRGTAGRLPHPGGLRSTTPAAATFSLAAHDWAIAPGLSFKVDGNIVTDDKVLYRLRRPAAAAQLASASESNVFVTQAWESWNFVGNMFGYQDLTDAAADRAEPAARSRAPGRAAAHPGDAGLPLRDRGVGFVNFVRDVGSNGLRADLHPRVSRTRSRCGGLFTVTPFAGGRLTYYDKRVVGHTPRRGITTPLEETDNDTQRPPPGRDRRRRADDPVTRVYNVGGFWDLDAILHTIEPARPLPVHHRPSSETGQSAVRPTSTTSARRTRSSIGVTNRISAHHGGGADRGAGALGGGALRRSRHTYDILDEEPVGRRAVGTVILQPGDRVRTSGPTLAYSTPRPRDPECDQRRERALRRR